MGGKPKKQPMTAGEALTELGAALDAGGVRLVDRSDYFVGDMDEGGITITPPEDDSWQERH